MDAWWRFNEEMGDRKPLAYTIDNFFDKHGLKVNVIAYRKEIRGFCQLGNELGRGEGASEQEFSDQVTW